MPAYYLSYSNTLVFILSSSSDNLVNRITLVSSKNVRQEKAPMISRGD